MNSAIIKEKLFELTKDLYFMSESDYPFEILDWGIKNNEEVKSTILSFHNKDSSLLTYDTVSFFTKIIDNFKNSGDALLLKMSERYTELFHFLSHNNFETIVYKCGKIEVGVYIVVSMKDSSVIVIKTTSIET